MPRKSPEDSHKVITKAERKARKEHETTAMREGLKATLDHGIVTDALHNAGVNPEVVKQFEEFLVDYENQSDMSHLEEKREVGESIIERYKDKDIVMVRIPEDTIEAETVEEDTVEEDRAEVAEAPPEATGEEEEAEIDVTLPDTAEPTIAELEAELARLKKEQGIEE